jgi:hypothetical protein
MSGGSARACLWLPSIPHCLHWFDVEYEWEDYPEQGNGWDDPGAGGVFYLTSVTWLTEERPPRYGLDVPKTAWDAMVGDNGKTLHQAICDDITDDVHAAYYEGDSYEDYDFSDYDV